MHSSSSSSSCVGPFQGVLNAASDKLWNVILFQVFHLFRQDEDLDTKEIELLCVMNHIPLHPFAIKSHPNLIPSLSNLPPMFPPFPPFPDTPSLRCSVTHHPLPVTCHIITLSFHCHYSSLSVSVITVLRYFGSLPPLLSSEHHSRLCGWMITI